MKLYYCRTDELYDLAGAELLPPVRRARMLRYAKSADRARCLAAGLLLRAALGAIPDLREGPHGKPYIEGGPCFNISHSGSYVILGLAGGEIGVDVEIIAPWDERIARRCFTAAELEWLYSRSDDAAFYKLWTAKESVMKATGLGFSLPPESFSVLPIVNGEHAINNESWFLRWFELPMHAVCCAMSAPESIELISLGREQLIR